MKKFWTLLMAAVVGVSAFSVLPVKTEGRKAKLKRTQNPIANRYVVVLDPKVLNKNSSSSEGEANRLAGDYGASVDMVYSSAVQGFAAG